MRKILIFIMAMLFFNSSWAQDAPPEMFKFQALITKPDGKPVKNKTVGVKISIRQSATNGTLVYRETFTPTTNYSGIINLEIGNGTPKYGVFSEIPWEAGEFFLKLRVDINGGTNYTNMGTSQLLSVPYALYAKHAQSVVGDNDTDPTNEIQTLSLDDNVLSLSDGGEVTLPSLEDFSYYFADRDKDAYGDRWSAVYSPSAPVGYVENENDCDDNDADVYPGAIEICDGIDNNCDGNIDEGVTTTYYADTDGDGYGDIENAIEACTEPSGYVSDNTDCDDSDSLVFPGTEEICDGKDNNCDGEIDEGCVADNDNDGFTIGQGDCNDSDPNINPGAEDICDGIDNDCDQDIDEDVDINTDPDNCGACGATCPSGTSCVGGICVPNTNTDNDEDGFTVAQGDCNDNDSSINPGAEEICDDVDNNCDGLVDEDCPTEKFGILTYEDITLTIETLGFGIFSQHDVQLECNESFQQSYLSDGALQIYLEGNDGGSSLLSKALSMDILTRYVGANLLYTQNEIAYSVQGKTLDFIASLYGVPVGVDVIRAVSFPTDIPLGIDQARDLLENELIDLIQALSNVEVNQQPSNSLLVVFVPMIESRESLEEAISQLDAEVLGQTTVIFINTSGATDDVIYDGGQAVDQDGDGYTVGQGDCNDNNPSINPGAQEVCYDGLDNNCNGQINEGCIADCRIELISVLNCVLQNCDGLGNLTCILSDCPDAQSTITSCLDFNCINDLSSSIDPAWSAEELADFLLENCGTTDEDGDGYSPYDGDCNDADINIYPGATEICDDGIDQDCNGSDTLCGDNDGDSFVSVTEGGNDCDDTNNEIFPGADEFCNGLDNNCDGLVDNVDGSTGNQYAYYIDADGDGYGLETSVLYSCEPIEGYVLQAFGDCDDSNSSIYPGAPEIVGNSLDEDCNGLYSWFEDLDQDGYGGINIVESVNPNPDPENEESATNLDCDDNNPNINPGTVEICDDGKDNNCDGLVDCNDSECSENVSCTTKDILILVDTTADMEAAISNLKAKSTDLLNDLYSYSNVAIGLAEFQDFPVYPYGEANNLPYQLLQPLSTDYNQVMSVIQGLSVFGGGDAKESGHEALYQALIGEGLIYPNGSIPFGQNIDFRNNSTRIVILITSAEFHNNDYIFNSNDFTKSLNQLINYNCNVISISVGSNPGYNDLVTYSIETDSYYNPTAENCEFDIDGQGLQPVNGKCPLVATTNDQGWGITDYIVNIVSVLLDQ